jgi:hypothetical protein
MRFRLALLALGILSMSLPDYGAPVLASPADRHSGTVIKVDAQAGTLVIEEMAVAGKTRQLRVRVTAETRVVLSERIPESQVTDLRNPFRETSIKLSDIRPGDFVTVELREEGKTAVASSVTVTVRGWR